MIGSCRTNTASANFPQISKGTCPCIFTSEKTFFWKNSFSGVKLEKRCRKSTLEKYSLFINNDPIEIHKTIPIGLSFGAKGNFLNSKR